MSVSRLARRAAVLTALVAAVLVAVVAALRVPWDWVPGGHLAPVSARSLFTPAQIRRCEHYSHVQRVLGWTSYGLSLLLVVVLGLTPLGARLLRRATPRRWWVAVPLGAFLLLLLQECVTLPLSALAHRTDRHYGISHQPWGSWSVDQLKSFVVSCLTTTVALLVVVALARRTPRWWFAWAGAAALVLGFAGSFLYPVVVEPLFNQFTPMRAGPFKDSVFALARRERVHVDDVLVADASRRTTTLNAYVSGFGDTRRVVVYDNTLEDLTPTQSRVIIAHELGHAEHDDVLLGTVLGAGGAVVGVALLALLLEAPQVRRWSATGGAADPAAVTLLLALVALGGFVVSPVQNTVSRAIEARADRASIETTHADAAFVQVQRQLALRSLADPTPPAWSQLWWGTHPTVLQRAGLPRSLERAGR